MDTRAARVVAALARGALNDAYTGDVPGRMLDGLARVTPATERRALVRALRALDSRPGALALTGRPVPVSWLTPAEAGAVLARWKASRSAPVRRLASGVLSLALSSLYGRPGPEWRRIGYPGPLGPAPDEPKRLAPIEIESGEELSCDVVVVGSGAGGGCAAAVLAAAGLDVVVLEKGGYYSESDFDHVEAEATSDMYLYGMTLATADQGVRIIAGSALGGGTVGNYATSFLTPERVRAEWARLTGIEAFCSGEFEDSLRAVAARLNVNTDTSAPGRRDQVLEDGLKKLGWHVDAMPRAVAGCPQDEACGYCGFGCRTGSKQSATRTFLEDAQRDGARLAVRAEAETVTIVDGRAGGIAGRTPRGPFTVRARAVVAACGAIETPALLLRSGVTGTVGKHLHLHPGAAAFGIFDDPVRIWEGTTQARFSLEFQDWDGGYGPMLETIPVHPGAGSVFIPWVNASHHRRLMSRFASIGFCGVLARDRGEGRVTIGRDGSPRVRYRISYDDERRIAEGIIKAGLVVEAAGARAIYSPHAFPISYTPGASGAHRRWAEETRARGYRHGAATFYSWHQMGSCRMGTDPASSAIDAGNESHETENLFVVDSSAFPTASGVNPMLTVYGIAHLAARGIAARLA